MILASMSAASVNGMAWPASTISGCLYVADTSFNGPTDRVAHNGIAQVGGRVPAGRISPLLKRLDDRSNIMRRHCHSTHACCHLDS